MSEEKNYLQLAPNFRLSRTDKLNLELEEFKDVTSKPNRYIKETQTTAKWTTVGFYGCLSEAVAGCLRRGELILTERQKGTLKDFLAELAIHAEDLQKAVLNSGIKSTDFKMEPDKRGRKPGTVMVAKVKSDDTPVKRGRGRPRKVTTK